MKCLLMPVQKRMFVIINTPAVTNFLHEVAPKTVIFFFCDVMNIKENRLLSGTVCMCVCVCLPFRQPPCLSGLSVSLSGLTTMGELHKRNGRMKKPSRCKRSINYNHGTCKVTHMTLTQPILTKYYCSLN